MVITRKMLRNWCACYDDEKIAKYVPDEGLTPLQVLDLNIPPADRIWVVMRDAVIPPMWRIELVCLWAERALSRVSSPDPRSVAAIEVTRRYVRGEATLGELSATKSAAAAAVAVTSSATDDYAAAAAAAAYAAADYAYAAYAISAYTSDVVAGDVADSAATASGYDARKQERDQQIEDVRRVLCEIYT